MYNTANVGVALIVNNNKGQILLGLRNSNLGKKTWGLPGGKLEKGETIENCIIRETKEEIGLTLEEMKYNCITNDIYEDGNHFVTIFVDAIKIHGIPTRMEPEKCLEWKYFDIDNLPRNLFLPVKNLINGDYYK